MEQNKNEQALIEAISSLARNLRRRPANAPRGSFRFIRLLSLISARQEPVPGEALSPSEGATPGELAELMDMRPSSLTEMLGLLEADGMIVRKRDENDLRVVRVIITEAGLNHLNGLRSRTPEYSIVKDILTSEECTEFIRLSAKLSEGMEKRARELFGDETIAGFEFGPRGPRDPRGPHGHHGPHGPKD